MAGVNGAAVASPDAAGVGEPGVTGRRALYRVMPMASAPTARFRPPEQLAGEVNRAGVLTHLRETAGECPIVLLNAPAGYGKTTVLAQWAASDPRPFIWLTMTDSRNVAEPSEITSVVAFLASDGGAYINGTTVFVDGGLMHSSPGL